MQSTDQILRFITVKLNGRQTNFVGGSRNVGNFRIDEDTDDIRGASLCAMGAEDICDLRRCGDRYKSL
jgi:hypothetical protein